MDAFSIRVAAPDALFDPYSAEPIEKRPLSDEVRERILYAWIDTREKRPAHLTVVLPEAQRHEHLASRLEEAIRNDFVATSDAARRLHIYTRSQRREAAVAFVFLIGCLLASTLIDQVTENDAFFTSVSQGLVVLGWVAMWQPAQQFFAAVTRRISYKRYRELSRVPIEVTFG